jgi:hypothetical protein
MVKKKYYRRKSKSTKGLADFIIYAIGGLTSTLFDAFSYTFKAYFIRSLDKKVGKPSRTLKGEMVKSRTEKRIADYLYRNKVQYIYEKPVALTAVSSIYPDFYLPQFDVYIEYYGLLNHPKLKDKYRKAVQFKRQMYFKKNIKVFELDHNQQKDIELHVGSIVSHLKRA